MSEPLAPGHLDHRRLWGDFDFCYPVLSRRSRGISLGVNLNPDKACNFDCVYCEVDRRRSPKRRDIDLDQVVQEMGVLLDLCQDGRIFEIPPFDRAPADQRRLNDLAFSGDGEPTTAPEFPEAVERLAHLKWSRGFHGVKLILITDASRLQAREVVQALDTLQANNGEIWAKLDAGTEAYYQEINRTRIPFDRILENLETTARLRPLTIQSLFLEWKGQPPSEEEITAYCGRLDQICRMGGRIEAIQVYTVARPTPEREARPLRAADLDRVAAQVKDALPALPLEVYYGPEAWDA
ncbi:MAG: radical SAM protein [Acidobacteria bacterium]|nr:radical SAM protein [Acidobacteriota bacterium]